jgi:hypothetical protein
MKEKWCSFAKLGGSLVTKGARGIGGPPSWWNPSSSKSIGMGRSFDGSKIWGSNMDPSSGGSSYS